MKELLVKKSILGKNMKEFMKTTKSKKKTISIEDSIKREKNMKNMFKRDIKPIES
jgi:hypothetical protein